MREKGTALGGNVIVKMPSAKFVSFTRLLTVNLLIVKFGQVVSHYEAWVAIGDQISIFEWQEEFLKNISIK